jgi:hypothetical protein
MDELDNTVPDVRIPLKRQEDVEFDPFQCPLTVTRVPPSIGPLLGAIDDTNHAPTYSYRRPLELSSASYPLTKSTVTLRPPFLFGVRHNTRLDDMKSLRG